MVQRVVQSNNFNLVSYEIRRLHKVGYSRIHKKKPGGGPRLAAIAHIKSASSLESYSLIEIDLSDFATKRSLSTLVFKYSCLDEARGRVDPILSALVAQSLHWPRDYFKTNKIRTMFINHEPGLSPLQTDGRDLKIKAWAEKVRDSLVKL